MWLSGSNYIPLKPLLLKKILLHRQAHQFLERLPDSGTEIHLDVANKDRQILASLWQSTVDRRYDNFALGQPEIRVL